MNMTLIHRRFVLAVVWLVINLGLGLQLSFASAESVENKLGITRDVLTDRIENLSTDIDIEFTSLTEKAIIRYTVSGKHESEKMLGRASLYYPVIEKEVYTKGLPEVLKFIPIIESALNPTARSRVGAVGLWQFMKGTARMQDLIVNRTIDERNDPVKSTYAAIDYLEYLYDKFGDWTLAIAAYNCGPGNVRKAIRRSGSRNYWEMRKFLPKETRNYIPKLIAAAYLMKYYHYHDLIPEVQVEEQLNISTTTVFQKVDFKELSKELNVEMEVLRQLNGEYLRNYVPADEKGRNIDIPSEKLYTFYEIYQPEEYELILEARQVALAEKKKRKKLVIQEIQRRDLPEHLFSMEELSVLQQVLTEIL